ncbi:31 kDa ribonucleoprotein, chloroplastic-like [Oryza brachyantha]|uniref:RRM domain-containing protein n=1 Tax=Oryza brachyantha TaxID=4533 RepID=J3M0W6_ORYBR|nr:31 kDa ribonucleoprotein, chloroplastic-like [Oryza brachyantha]XP_040379281.1 31 kDa ribonucleoprotein, chloroplastic-like [Oryza brachyantha]
MALSLARSPHRHPAAALPAPRICRLASLLRSSSPRRRPCPLIGPSLRLRLTAAAFAASSPPEAQAAAADEEEEEAEEGEKRRKLYVANIPWSLPAPEIEKLFAQCGAVKDVEVIKGKDGKKKGFAFVTMSTTEEAAAAVEKLNSLDVMGRTIRVEFSKSFRKPAPPPPPGTIVERHKLYVSNLPWKARAPNMKEFFTKFNPLSAKVVFDSPSGKSAGYGFVSFGTKEEAEAALSELDGKELMGRPVRLRWRQNTDDTVDSVKADREIEDVNIDGEAEGALDNGSVDDGEDKQ